MTLTSYTPAVAMTAGWGSTMPTHVTFRDPRELLQVRILNTFRKLQKDGITAITPASVGDQMCTETKSETHLVFMDKQFPFLPCKMPNSEVKISSALECVPQDVSVISTLNAGFGYFL